MKNVFRATFFYFIFAIVTGSIMDLIAKGDFFLSFKTYGPEIMVAPFAFLIVFIVQLAFAQILKNKTFKLNRYKSTIVFAMSLNFLISFALYAPEYRDFWTTFGVMLGLFSIPFILSQLSFGTTLFSKYPKA